MRTSSILLPLLVLCAACSNGPQIPPGGPGSPNRPIQGHGSTSGSHSGSRGWYCFTIIYRDKSRDDVSECQRTVELCKYQRYEYDRSDEFNVTSCELLTESVCFKVKHRPSGLIEDQCSMSMAQCAMRHYVVSKYKDEYELVSGCSRRR